ncbi:diguanylate cyclase [Deferribacterales bacterium Es71-Z0220]|uniref:GGDEF domain-containing response regulator n=1 Tax=Deferrivibrio essentukiensis TaxID=2880922 RepID=UPI001F62217F|nr:diguanylate cyclase [Deferrivibrio essentukiensis]MCB4204407.1 diguanylate cyclase [Deferrivibrio essentukiensis]
MLEILIADDDKDAQNLLGLYINKLGFKVHYASNGIDALNKINELNISIALLDWMMPGMSGIEITQKIRESKIDRYVYIIMVTGKSEKDDTIEALHNGVDDYIVKPFTFQELKVRIFAAERIIKLENKLKNAYNKLYNESIHDVLTGVLNRKALMEKIEDYNNKNKSLGIIMIDIDNFKVINDTYGHLVGDQILKEFSAIISNTIRKSDFVGRYGGEEFLAVIPDLDVIEVKTIAERIRKNIESETFHIGSLSLKITASLGVYVLTEKTKIEDAIKLADDALYEAKKSGKNKVIVY